MAEVLATYVLGTDTISTIEAGVQNENDASCVKFDYSDWKEEYGDGILSMRIQRREDDDPYPVLLTVSTDPDDGENVMVWSISDVDTAQIGKHKAQLTYTVDGVRKKTTVFLYRIVRSVVSGDTVPDPYDDWLEDLESMASDMLDDGAAIVNEAKGYRNEASGYATAASGSATSASNSASDSEAYAKGTRGGTAVDSEDPAYHKNSKYYSEQAATSASNASDSASTANTAKESASDYAEQAYLSSESASGYASNASSSATDASGFATNSAGHSQNSEAWAKGTRGGTAVGSDDPAYHNNSKYFSEQASAIATAAAGSATAAAASVSSLAPAYSSSATYDVGDYVLYSGSLYRCTTAITTAEEWTASHWTSAKMSEDVSDLKDELNEFETDTIETVVTSKNLYNPAVSETGAIQSDGSVATNGTWANYKTSDFIPLDENTDYILSSWIMSSGTETTTRKLLLLYDANKAIINDSYQNAEQYSLTFNSSSNAKYVRCATVGTLGMQLEKGTNYSVFVPYAERKDLLIRLGETPSNQVIDLINNSGIITYEVGKNLANPNTFVTGAIQSNGSVATNGSWTGYSTTDFIKIESAENYVASQWSNQGLLATGRMLLLLFDENKAPISGTYQNTDAVNNLTFSNASAKYVRVSARKYMIFQVEKGTTPTIYEKFSGKNVVTYPLGNVPMTQTQASNPLYKKKWAVCGDSFTNGATENRLTDGKYAGQRIVYPYIIGNRNEMDIVKFFDGGRTLAYPSDGTFHNSLTDPAQSFYYQNIPSDADYITIYLGINDEHHATGGGDGEDPTGVIPLGTITDNTTATYYGAWNVVLSWLIENRPFAHIGMIVTNGLSIADYRTAQIAIAEKYGIPYIDLNGDKQTHAMIRSVNPDISSTVKNIINQKQAVNYPSNMHPNDAAHEYESSFIEHFLRSI